MTKIRCILCGSENNKFVIKGNDRYMGVDKKEFNIRQCLECKLTSLVPMPTEDQLLNYYPDDYKVFTVEKKKL